MNGLPLHPAVVHIPVALALVLPVLAIGVLVAARLKPGRQALFLLVAAQAALVIGGFVAMQTGEGAEHEVKGVVPRAAIHEHEEHAETFVWVGVGALVVAIAALGSQIARKEAAARALALAFAVATLVVAFLGFRTGEAGGELVYVHNAGSAYSRGAEAGGVPNDTQPPTEDHGSDDDDD
ncbi:MAG: hypothetical protein H6745_20970 [Deltaproteobacteria bacterium]|nr:hypothetical protein [Deltaproteobacteria bacterium]